MDLNASLKSIYICIISAMEEFKTELVEAPYIARLKNMMNYQVCQYLYISPLSYIVCCYVIY